jgi:hypothetical protein
LVIHLAAFPASIVPSDACLVTGYDRKRLIISQESGGPVRVNVKADFTGTGAWAPFTTVSVPPDRPLEYEFPEAFGAYWLRLLSESDTMITAKLIYE